MLSLAGRKRSPVQRSYLASAAAVTAPEAADLEVTEDVRQRLERLSTGNNSGLQDNIVSFQHRQLPASLQDLRTWEQQVSTVCKAQP